MNKSKNLINMFLMASALPKDTGLPTVIWIEEISDETKKYVPQIRVMPTKGKIRIEETVIVTIEDEPRSIGNLPINILKKVVKWVKLNRQLLEDHYYHRIDAVEFYRLMQKVKGGD